MIVELFVQNVLEQIVSTHLLHDHGTVCTKHFLNKLFLRTLYKIVELFVQNILKEIVSTYLVHDRWTVCTKYSWTNCIYAPCTWLLNCSYKMFFNKLYLRTLYVIVELFVQNVLQQIFVRKRKELRISELPGDVLPWDRRKRQDLTGDVIQRPVLRSALSLGTKQLRTKLKLESDCLTSFV